MRKTKAVIFLTLLLSAGMVFAAPLLKEVCIDLAQKNEGKSAVEGADGWLFLKDELIHLSSGRFWGEDAAQVSRSKKKEYADPLPAIIRYNEALADKGVTLYLMPVPPKALVYPDKLVDGVVPGGVEEERALYTEFYRQLRESGVNVIDLLPELTLQAAEKNVYCKTDTHFSGDGLALFAAEAAKALRAEAWYESLPQQEFVKTDQNVSIVGDLSQMLGKTDTEELTLSLVTSKATGSAVISDENSPVVLLGDSHTLVFSAGGDLHAKSAGLFDHLSADLGFPLDLLGVRGSGITPARVKLFQRSKKNPDYLSGKKAVIWCFTAREFTGTGGWREIPVAGK
ncbi:alginate O-acetyltransferase AlgX-related protein [Desulforhopalus sp. 52FAK]